MEPVNLDIKSAAQYLGISWRYLDDIKCQQLDPENKKLVRYVSLGKRILFPIDELNRFNEQLKREQWAGRDKTYIRASTKNATSN